jgi:pilus assembly protein TadC
MDALLSGVAVCLAAGMTLGDALNLVEDEAGGLQAIG